MKKDKKYTNIVTEKNNQNLDKQRDILELRGVFKTDKRFTREEERKAIEEAIVEQFR